MSLTLVLSIKLATVISIPYFGVSTVFMLSLIYLPQVVGVKLCKLAWNNELFIMLIKLANIKFVLFVV